VDIVCTLYGLSTQEFGFNVVDISGQVVRLDGSRSLSPSVTHSSTQKQSSQVFAGIHCVLPKCDLQLHLGFISGRYREAPGEPYPPCQVASNDEMEV